MVLRTKEFWVAVLCFVCIVGLISCSTIMTGSKKEIGISSTPTNANVVIKSTKDMEFFNGKTPATVKLPKKNEYFVTISLDGYKEETVNITKDGIAGWFWVNILCGGIIGIIVDVSTGAINNLAPDEISVSLETAHLSDQKKSIFVVFHALDSGGQLRVLRVPLVKDNI